MFTTSAIMNMNSHMLLTNPLLCFLFLSSFVYGQLDYKYYDYTCPNLTKIVRYGVWFAISNDTRMPASLLRLHFHDCFANECDGSVLLDDTSTFTGEKNAFAYRNSARGYEVIDAIKLMWRNLAHLQFHTRGPYWSVSLGRRDSLTESRSAANDQIPSSFMSLENITAKFVSKGLDVKAFRCLHQGVGSINGKADQYRCANRTKWRDQKEL